MFKLNFHRQTASAIEETPELETVREDFTMDIDSLTILDLLNALRDRTYNFALDNGLTSATTEFTYVDDLPLVVRLTEDYNVLYTINRYTTASLNDAVAVLQDAVQF